ncbi:MAG TPA: cadherin domain-containing protein, partial [Polymorphobacter sp.]|nr:cadherin domain-containing protein [Polymorphobacter sp.]
MTMTFGTGGGASDDEDEVSAIGGLALTGGYDLKQARLVLGATPPAVILKADTSPVVTAPPVVITDTPVPATGSFAPIITSNGGGASASISLAENLSAVTTVRATDGDGNAITYSISGGADASKFTINSSSGVLQFVTAANFEAPTDFGANNVYDVIVRASDGSLFDFQAIAVTVTNVNEVPIFTGGPSATISVAENATAVTTVAATDADAGAALTYGISGGADAARFSINAATGALKFITAPDFEKPTDSGANNVYDVIVSASDGTLSANQAIAVTVTNTNETSVFTSPTAVGFADDRTGVAYQASATKDTGETLAWSMSGTDAALFNINAATGAVTFKAAPDYQAPVDSGKNNDYDITVTASDGSQAVSQGVTVSVLPLSSFAPYIASGATASVPERTTSTVYYAAAVQPSGSTAFNWTLGGADAAKFNIAASTGQVSFKVAPSFTAPVDVGANNVYDVIVTASDGTLSSSKAVAISVTNAAESTALVNGLGGAAGFGTTSLARADDASQSIDITSVFSGGLNWFGTVYNSMYVNNNGLVSFNTPVSIYNPQVFPYSNLAAIAPFWADVDTRYGAQTATPGGTSTGSNLVWYNVDSSNGVITITWDDVQGYGGVAGLDAFQLRIIARPEGSTSAGSSLAYGANTFDVEFRYEAINWTRGSATPPGGAGVGWDAGNSVNYFNLPGSQDAGITAALDTAAVVGQPTIGTVLLTNVGGVGMLPTITTAALAKAEGQSGTTPFSVLVVRQGDVSRSATVDWSVTGTGVNAASAADFAGGVLPGGTLTFAAGAAMATVNLQVVADRVAELDETFALVLSNPVGATVINTTTTMTILRDESAPTLTSGTTATVAENVTGTAYQAAAVAA